MDIKIVFYRTILGPVHCQVGSYYPLIVARVLGVVADPEYIDCEYFIHSYSAYIFSVCYSRSTRQDFRIAHLKDIRCLGVR
jgi:hypothetical protein